MGRKVILVLAIGVGLVLLILYLMYPAKMGQVWIWIVGLFGTLIGWGQKLLGGGKLSEIEKSNAQLQKQLDGLKAGIAQSHKERLAEDAKYQAEIKDLKSQLEASRTNTDRQIDRAEDEIRMNHEEFMQTLTPEEQAEREEFENNAIDFTNQP